MALGRSGALVSPRGLARLSAFPSTPANPGSQSAEPRHHGPDPPRLLTLVAEDPGPRAPPPPRPSPVHTLVRLPGKITEAMKSTARPVVTWSGAVRGAAAGTSARLDGSAALWPATDGPPGSRSGSIRPHVRRRVGGGAFGAPRSLAVAEPARSFFRPFDPEHPSPRPLSNSRPVLWELSELNFV